VKFTRNPTAEDLPGATPEAAPEDDSTSPTASIRDEVIEVLKTIYDPEIPVNIYELGLIYDIELDESNFVKIQMTLTSPACPVAGSLPPEVENKASMVPGVSGAKVDLVWDPPWDMSKMSDAAKLQLNLM
jgi:FeS assembly SUF system protein